MARNIHSNNTKQTHLPLSLSPSLPHFPLLICRPVRKSSGVTQLAWWRKFKNLHLERGNIFCTNVELFKSIEIQLTADLFTGVHRCLTSPLHRLVYKFFQSHFNSCMIVRGLHWETAVLMHCCDPECLKLWKLQSTFASSGCSVSGEKSSVEVGSRG